MQPMRKSWSTRISLTTQIKQADDIEQFQFEEEATLTLTDNALYIRYTEHQQDVNDTPVTFKITTTNDILLHRHNYFTDVQLHFMLGQFFQTHYVTPQGNIPITVQTDELFSDISPQHPYGKLTVSYTLQNNHVDVGRYQLALVVIPKS